MSQISLKTGDLDLDLQGHIGLETKKLCYSLQQLLNRGNFKFKLELCIDHLKVLDYSKNVWP